MKNPSKEWFGKSVLSPGILFSAVFLLVFFLLRMALAVWVHEMLESGVLVWLRTLWVGVRLDLMAGLLLALPAAIFLWVVPSRLWKGKGVFLLRGAYFFALFLFLFLVTTEVFFFDEFNARFNYIAVDYLLFPTEVAGNIWQSYPVLWVVTGVGCLALLIFFLTYRVLERGVDQSRGWTAKLLGFHVVAFALLWITTPLSSMTVSENRVQNEVASNGVLTFIRAAWTNDLNYDGFYYTLDKAEAFRRVNVLLEEEEQGTRPVEAPNPLERSLTEDGTLSRPNFVIIVEESFGASFTGVLRQHPEGITPSFDRLAEAGLLFTRFYATGSRTVRGLEAILCGFPPIPGVSILKRKKSENVFTLADVVKARGYETLFVYGGRGLFDGMGAFMRANGFDRFIEQKDFASPVFTTAWGVSDEDIFHRGLEEFESLHAQKKSFLAVILTVSNHKPYTYPAGRIDLDPNRRRREHAVKYADWALGDFFERARTKGFFKNTVFVVIGDHGARVYGADFIPIRSYEVPFLIYAPDLVKPGRVDTLASSMDVAPTLVGLTNWTLDTGFFGRDLFDVPTDHGYALLQHDRDVGFLRGDRLAVYRPDKSATVYLYDREEFRFHPAEFTPGDDDLVKDGAALYQTAYELYDQRRLRLKNGRF
jgi:phosphoglycerol transferase MdoB-like AlkP superfamily enzyme